MLPSVIPQFHCFFLLSDVSDIQAVHNVHSRTVSITDPEDNPRNSTVNNIDPEDDPRYTTASNFKFSMSKNVAYEVVHPRRAL